MPLSFSHYKKARVSVEKGFEIKNQTKGERMNEREIANRALKGEYVKEIISQLRRKKQSF